MKKMMLFILLFGSLTMVNAQKQSYQEKKAIEQTDYVSSRMKLNDSKKLFLHNVLLEKYESISKQVKGKGLSKEQKKVINKKINTAMTERLTTEFSKKEVKEIKTLLKEQNKSKKK